MKTIEQIQKENRKFILEAIHNCNYEEALKKELGFGCQILVKGEYRTFNNENGKYECGEGLITMDTSNYVGDIDLEKNIIYTDKYGFEKIIEIIGKPITLDRLLLALPHEKIKIELDDVEIGWHGPVLLIKYNLFGPRKFYWRLEKKTILLTLEEQSEETQREINKFLNAVKIYQQ